MTYIFIFTFSAVMLAAVRTSKRQKTSTRKISSYSLLWELEISQDITARLSKHLPRKLIQETSWNATLYPLSSPLLL
jgi:hypothetical protein